MGRNLEVGTSGKETSISGSMGEQLTGSRLRVDEAELLLQKIGLGLTPLQGFDNSLAMATENPDFAPRNNLDQAPLLLVCSWIDPVLVASAVLKINCEEVSEKALQWNKTTHLSHAT